MTIDSDLLMRAWLDPSFFSSNKSAITKQVDLALQNLNSGQARIAQKKENQWEVNEVLKIAVLLYFRLQQIKTESVGPFVYNDKIPLKSHEDLMGVRTVPGSIVRFGAFIENGAILMPSFVNIGAYIGSGTMVDTWATVGSCAQIGKRVHLSGGVGIGGVLEPPQASPVVIEDDVFIGSRCVVVEGVRVCEGAVLGANVVLTQSTKIIDVTGSEPKEIKDHTIPPRSVVIPGVREKTYPAGKFGIPCSLIIGQRKKSTDEKTSLNDALRDFGVSV